jgi:hypothetical protein
MQIYLAPHLPFSQFVRYVLLLISQNQGVDLEFVSEVGEGGLVFDPAHPRSQALAIDFYQELQTPGSDFAQGRHFAQDPTIRCGDGRVDRLATIFYLVNCLQEWRPKADERDRFGRFRYESSFQHRFGCIERNLVQEQIDACMAEWGWKGRPRPSGFFVSHDIDTIYGSLKEDGFWALKRGRIDVLLRLIANAMLARPHWRNMDAILRLNTEYDVKTTFFWLVNKGIGESGIKNADYHIAREQALPGLVAQRGFDNGLHKSCSPMTIDQELDQLGRPTTFNRYHFLRFLPHVDWPKISASRLDLDSSLGFAEHIGFRNGYGAPFQPFDLANGRPYDFVEAPLTLMDSTLHRYMGIPVPEIGQRIIDFCEAHPTSCVFSLLWHNTYFTDYKYGGLIAPYKQVLAYIHERKLPVYAPQDLVAQTRMTW